MLNSLVASFYYDRTHFTKSIIHITISAINENTNQNGYDAHAITYIKWLDYQLIIKNKTTKYGVLIKGRSVEHEIGIIRLYFDYLVHKDYINLNPICDKFYKADSDFIHQLLSKEELQELYLCFPTLEVKHPSCKSVAIRNKVIIGLVVFQALDTTTIKNLSITDIDLNNHKIHVSGTKRSNARNLDLNSFQLSVLRQYIDEDRTILQKKINCFTEALFPLNTHRFSCLTADITKKLKMLNLKVTNLRQLRASVLTLWVMKHDLRKVQIMAGHRYISTTENYLKNDLNSLQEATEMYHPMQ